MSCISLGLYLAVYCILCYSTYRRGLTKLIFFYTWKTWGQMITDHFNLFLI